MSDAPNSSKDTSVFPDPVYKDTVLKPLFDGAKTHFIDGFRLIDRGPSCYAQRDRYP